MTLTLDSPNTEVRTLAVLAAHESRVRARMAVAGWRLQYKVVRADGTVELTFARRKMAASEVQP